MWCSQSWQGGEENERGVEHLFQEGLQETEKSQMGREA